MNKQTPKITWWTYPEYNGLLYKLPPVSSMKHFPKIFKNMPKNNPVNGFFPTARRCPAFADLYKHMYVLPMWCDVSLTYEGAETGKCQWETPNIDIFNLDIHGNQQFIDFLPESKKDWHMVWKFNSPWLLKTPKGYSVLQLPLTYEFNPDFEVMSGVIDTDIHHQLTIPVVQKRLGNIEIKRGTPLCMYLPFKRDKFELEVVLETQELWVDKMKNYWNMVTAFGSKKSKPNPYREAQKERDEQNDRKAVLKDG
jgi:hypothetical protein